MLYGKILVAYDGSELSKKALDYAAALAKSDSSIEIEVIAVAILPTAYTGYDYVPVGELLDAAMKQANESLEQAERALAELPNRTETFLARGYPAAAILEHAKAHGNDLIIMGSRGLSGIKELFLGSISHYVVQHSPIPVLIIK